jgi:hypothetical protein
VCHDRVWYERKIELTRLNLTVVGKHVDVNRTVEAPELCSKYNLRIDGHEN